jgi:hypothetical protein
LIKLRRFEDAMSELGKAQKIRSKVYGITRDKDRK